MKNHSPSPVIHPTISTTFDVTHTAEIRCEELKLSLTSLSFQIRSILLENEARIWCLIQYALFPFFLKLV